MSKMSRQEAEEIVQSARFVFPASSSGSEYEAVVSEGLVKCYMEYGPDPTADQIQAVVFREAAKREALDREAKDAEFKAQLARAIGMDSRP